MTDQPPGRRGHRPICADCGNTWPCPWARADVSQERLSRLISRYDLCSECLGDWKSCGDSRIKCCPDCKHGPFSPVGSDA